MIHKLELSLPKKKTKTKKICVCTFLQLVCKNLRLHIMQLSDSSTEFFLAVKSQSLTVIQLGITQFDCYSTSLFNLFHWKLNCVWNRTLTKIHALS